MAAADGKWDCSVSTPMGDQEFTFTVVTNGDRFSGTLAGSLGTLEVPDGEVDGDTLLWTMNVPKPMPLTLTCSADVSGDTLKGKLKAGIFGSFDVTGKRAA